MEYNEHNFVMYVEKMYRIPIKLIRKYDIRNIDKVKARLLASRAYSFRKWKKTSIYFPVKHSNIYLHVILPTI